MNLSKSQPSLQFRDVRAGSLELKNKSLDLKDNDHPRDIIRHKLMRSRSSGAKYSRFRDKYKQSNLNKSAGVNNSEGNLSKGKLGKSQGSTEGGSDVEDLPLSDWGSEEAACDEEVRS